MPDPNETPHIRAIGRGLALLAWPAALWALAFFFHLGTTGPRSDDWFWDFTSPVTGEPHRLVISTWATTHFRPLHHIYVPFISTAFAEAWWVAVFFASVGHALAAGVLWHLMRTLGIGRPAASAAAVLWMLYPVLFEVPLWVAAASTSIATAVALGVLMIALRFARGSSFWSLPAIAGGAYICCAFNEQPAAVFAAFPFLAPAARESTWKQIAWRVPTATLSAGLGVGIYLALTFGYLPFLAEGQPDSERGSASTLVTSVAELETRWNTTKDAANDIMWMPGMFRAALGNGLGTLRLGPLHAGWFWSVPFVLLIAIAGWATTRAWLRAPDHDASESTSVRLRLAQLLVGVAMFFAGFVPILVIRDHGMYTRLAYIPAVGLAIGTAAMLDAATTLGPWFRRGRTLAMLAVFLGLVPATWALATLGIQDGLFRRVLQDQHEADQLRALVPDPPENAAIIVVRNDHRVTTTGVDRFDGLFPGATTIAWAAPEWARDAYGRWDVWAAPAWYNFKGPVIEATDAGIRLDATMLDKLHPTPGAENDPLLIPWSRAITIAIDADGTVRLVTAFDMSGRIVRHPSLEHADGVTIAIPVRPGPPK